MDDYKYVGPGWRAQVGVLEWTVEEILGSRLVAALDATFPPTPGWGKPPVSDPSETLAFKSHDPKAEDVGTVSLRYVPGPADVTFTRDSALETLALMAEHKIRVSPAMDGGWVADWSFQPYIDARGATIGDAVRLCVKRIREGR